MNWDILNSSNDDLSFVSINGNKGYLSSNHKGSSNFDIYFLIMKNNADLSLILKNAHILIKL